MGNTTRKEKAPLVCVLRMAIRVTIACFSLIAAYYLLRGYLGMSDKDVYLYSTSGFGGVNYELAKNLLAQKLDTTIGFIFMLLVFILQSIDLLMPVRIEDFMPSKLGFTIGLTFSIVVFIIMLFIHSSISKTFPKKVQKIYQAQSKQSV